MPKQYHTIFNLLALSIIVYIGVDTFYTFVGARLSQRDTRTYVAPQSQGSQEQQEVPFDHYRPITQKNIFHSTDAIAQKEKKAEEEDIEALEPTTLKIALLGTVTGSSQNAYAVIEETNKRKQGLFRIGDSVQNAVIKMILRGKVVLRVGDRDEILTMEEAVAQANKTQNRLGVASRPSPGPGTPSRTRTVTVNRSDVEASFEDLNQLLSEVRVRPHFKDGQPNGLAISRIKKDSIFGKLGLRDGDIVQSIDNAPIQSPDDIMTLYQKLKSGSRIGIQIDRRGQQQTIDYTFR